jgi:light-regulated signal transduction histidine kinase (bacteriophytochrome)
MISNRLQISCDDGYARVLQRLFERQALLCCYRPMICIGISCVVGEQRHHKITVADKGIGFEAQYADRIFEVFQRVYNKDEFEDTGIGLAICRKIIQNNKGYIAAYGKPGLGALFVIYLPAEG